MAKTRLPKPTQGQLEELNKTIAEYFVKLGMRIKTAKPGDAEVSPSRELALEILYAGYRKQ
jgi:hypothetical protein